MFKRQDVEGDGLLDKDEMHNALVKLSGDNTKFKTFDDIKKAIINNIK